MKKKEEEEEEEEEEQQQQKQCISIYSFEHFSGYFIWPLFHLHCLIFNTGISKRLLVSCFDAVVSVYMSLLLLPVVLR